jgi:anti-sigma factor RsiW
VSNAHGQHSDPGNSRRTYPIAGIGERSSAPTPMAHVDDLIPGYALGALDAAEAAAVDAHVSGCATCEHALADLRAAAGMLPFLVPLHTPAADNKAALFARVAHVQKASLASGLPMTSGAAYRTPTLPASNSREFAPAVPHDSGPATAARRVSRSGWLASAVSLPLLVALIATGFWGIQMRNQLSTQDAQLVELQSEFANFASGSTSYPLSPGFDAPQAEGQIVMGANERDGFLQIDVNSKDGPQSYELLVNHEGQLESAGKVTVNGDGQGQAQFELTQPFSEYESVHIRAIPVDGSVSREGLDTLMRDSEGPLGSTGSGLDIGT